MLIALAFASGIIAALSSRAELRVTPRPMLLTRAFTAYALFLAMVLVPISVYFYVFHGDWFMLYLVDVQSVPSAVALVGFLLEMALGSAGFLIGSTLVRTQRENVGMLLSIAAVLLALLAVFPMRDRLAVVGSFAQFTRRYGLSPYLLSTERLADSPVFLGTAAMSVILFAAFAYLIYRLRHH